MIYMKLLKKNNCKNWFLKKMPIKKIKIILLKNSRRLPQVYATFQEMKIK